MSIANAKAQDPSMEEILASIRRIIADDQDGPKSPRAADAPKQSVAVAAVTESVASEEVLDLADLHEADRTARPRSADLDVEVPDLTFGESETGVIDDEPARRVPRPRETVTVRGSEVAAEPARPAQPAAQAPPRADNLISRETDETVAQAFGLLSHTVLKQNSHTLEDLVREMLKPMLKVWLDDNLPPLVERLVRSEIERVARGGR